MSVRKKRPPLKKRLFKNALFIWLGSHVLALVLRAIYLTSRIEKHFPEATRPYLRGEKPAIFCFWHGRMVMHPFLRPAGREMHVLISRHADGRMISTIMRRFGVDTVHGSSGKRVREALEGLSAALLSGDNIAITPDGPRGPLQKAAVGAAYVAQRSGSPIICISFSSTRHWRFSSWDRFMLPKPFGRIAFAAAEPLHLAHDESDDAIAAGTLEIETILNNVTEKADGLCGVPA